MYTLNATDIDNGGEFFRKLNANFAESANPQSSHTLAECRTRFIAEMNRKAALLGMTNTTFYEPAGNQPSNYYTNWTLPELWIINDRNVMTSKDALRLLIYASGIRVINDAWNIRSFTLNYMNGTTSKTANILSTVYNNTTCQSSIDSLLASYDILGGKTGSYENVTNTLVVVARSKTTGKVYACVDFRTTLNSSSSDNKFIHTKSILDAADNNGNAPSYANGGYCVIELPTITPSLLNRADITPIISQSPTTQFYPASVTKVMTAVLLAENVANLEQKVTVKEGDRQPQTGSNFVDGDVMRLRELLQCLLMESSNTSAHVIARVVGGILLDKDANVFE